MGSSTTHDRGPAGLVNPRAAGFVAFFFLAESRADLPRGPSFLLRANFAWLRSRPAAAATCSGDPSGPRIPALPLFVRGGLFAKRPNWGISVVARPGPVGNISLGRPGKGGKLLKFAL